MGHTVVDAAPFIAALVLLWTGQARKAAESLDSLRTEALELGRESDVPLMYLYLVWAHLWSGDVARALEEAGEARQTARRLDDRTASALALSASALAAAYAGDEAAVGADVQTVFALCEQTQWHSGIVWPCWALGFLELSLGNNAAAVEVLGPLGELLGDMSAVDPVIAVFLPDEVKRLLGSARWKGGNYSAASSARRARSAGTGPWP